MSDAPAPAPRNSYWNRKPKAAPLPADHAKRQGEITRLAFVVLGREPALAFLNAANDELGGRPLDLATASAEGLARVEEHLSRMAYRQAGAQTTVGEHDLLPLS